jgi:hypothetical protein
MPLTWGRRNSSVSRAKRRPKKKREAEEKQSPRPSVSSPIHVMLGLGEQTVAATGKVAQFTPDGKGESKHSTRKLLEVMVPKRDSRITRNSVKRQHKLSVRSWGRGCGSAPRL